MSPSDDDATTQAKPIPSANAEPDDERELVLRASAGDQQAFDLLYDRYFARASWYFFTIFSRRKAKAAVTEVLTELFGSLSEPSDQSLAERAYRLSVATELRHAAIPEQARPTGAKPAKVAGAQQDQAGRQTSQSHARG
jgi:hypothetical protein